MTTPDRGVIVMRSNTLNQRGEVVQTLTAIDSGAVDAIGRPAVEFS